MSGCDDTLWQIEQAGGGVTLRLSERDSRVWVNVTHPNKGGWAMEIDSVSLMHALQRHHGVSPGFAGHSDIHVHIHNHTREEC